MQQHAEFVAAEARHDVVGADPLLQHLTELAQQLVTSDVAAGVVHRLETVEVEVEHRVLRPRRLRQLERALQPQLEFTAVRQTRQCVVTRFVRQLQRKFVGGRDVGQGAFVEQRAAVGIGHGTGILQDDDLRAVLALQYEFGVADLAGLLHRPGPVAALFRVHVDVAGDVELEQLVLGVVTEHAHECRIRRHELAVRGRLEHASRHVLEQFAISLLRRLQGQHRVRALGRVPQHTLDQRRTEMVALQ